MIDWRRRSYTKEAFIQAWVNSTRMTDIVRVLGLRKSQKTYDSLRVAAEELGLNNSHFTYETPTNIYRTLEEILVENSPYKGGSSSIYKKLIKAGLKNKNCEECGLDEWLKKPLVLELDHINGDPHDNRLENLRALCPNCHSQTPTWRGKGKIRITSRGSLPRVREVKFCENPSCSTALYHGNTSGFCSNHVQLVLADKDKEGIWPEIDALVTECLTIGYEAVGRRLDVSGNAIRKHIKRRIGYAPSSRQVNKKFTKNLLKTK